MKLEIIKGITVIITFLNFLIGVIAIASYYIPHPDFMLLSDTVNQLPITWILFISSMVFFYLSLVWLWLPKKYIR